MSHQLDEWCAGNYDRHLDELMELLRIPSVSTDPEAVDAIASCAQLVKSHLDKLGFETEVWETPGHPIVYGEWLGAPDAPTVMIYGHYDVQPPEPLEEWRSPPFEPTIEDDKWVVARGATDDKGQFFAHIKGIEAHMKTAGRLPVNVKVVIEGEEEIGSPNLAPTLEAKRDRLSADIALVSDTSMWAPGRPALTAALRGLAYIEVSVQGASHDLHSGQFGGGVANPINGLAKIIASLHDDDGRVTVPGFYDGIVEPTPELRAQLKALDHDEAGFKKELNIEETPGEAGWTILERITIRPTLDCNGIVGGYTGPGAKTVLPAKASTKISCRLVDGQDPDDITDKLIAHLESIVPPGLTITCEPHHGGPPVVVDTSVPAFDAAMSALSRVWEVDAVYTYAGGSIPIVKAFRDILGLETVLMGLGQDDDRLHSPNEKFDLINFRQGIRASAWFLTELAAQSSGEA